MSDKVIRTTCSYCSVGCNFDAVISEGRLKSFLPSKSYPVNLGKSCPKGFHLLKAFEAPDRVTSPLLRNSAGELEPVSWEKALSVFVERFKAIGAESGPESVSFLSTGQMPMEEMAFLGAIFKFGMGFIHADGNTRQCMATAAVAYKQAFGFDAPPFTYTDFEESDLLIFVGANPVIAHPVMWNHVRMNRKDPTIVVLDPRRTKTAEEAHVHLPVRPRSDLVLLYGIANRLIEKGWIDDGFVEKSVSGFAEFRDHVKDFTPERVEREAGIDAAALDDLVARIHRAKAMSMYWTMGVNQGHQAVRTAQAIINICLLTGNIGRPGTGPNSITGQANAMGSRLYSNTTNLLGGHDFLNPAHREKIAKILGIEAERIPAANSLPYHKILERVDSGLTRGLWIVATNPGHSWIDKNHFYETMKKAEFVVVQDLYYSTETAQFADLVLPAAGSGEKEGTFINSERRIGTVGKILDPPGEAKSDFDIFRAVADAWGCGEMFREWSSPEAVFRILQRCSKGQPCDISGIDGYRMIRERGGVQWPYPEGETTRAENRLLFADGKFFTSDGRAKLLFDPIAALPETPDEIFPFVLLTGRGTVVQWHTQTRTGKVDMLNRLRPAEAYAEISTDDAARLGIAEGGRVRVSSRRGTVVVNAAVTDSIPVGQVFMPMHYDETNLLTFPAFDPYSAEPAYKFAAVSVAAGE